MSTVPVKYYQQGVKSVSSPLKNGLDTDLIAYRQPFVKAPI